MLGYVTVHQSRGDFKVPSGFGAVICDANFLLLCACCDMLLEILSSLSPVQP